MLDFLTGAKSIESSSKSTFVSNIGARASFCEQLSIPYRHIIFPDKHTVLAELFPINAVVRMGDEYMSALSSDQKSVLFPVESLRSIGPAAYLQLDTHLSATGIIAVIQHIYSDIFGATSTSEFSTLLDRVRKTELYSGDLGSKLNPPIELEKIELDRDWPLVMYSNGVTSGNDGIIDLIFSPRARTSKRILIFGDSFFRSSLQVLSFFFEEVYFFRTRYFHQEIVTAIRPDCVLTGNVERYLSKVSRDEEAPHALLYPALLRSDYNPSPDFLEALNAILCYGRPPYQQFRTRTLTRYEA